MLKGKRTMDTDSLFILLLPARESESEVTFDDVRAGGQRIGTLRPVFEGFFEIFSIYIYMYVCIYIFFSYIYIFKIFYVCIYIYALVVVYPCGVVFDAFVERGISEKMK